MGDLPPLPYAVGLIPQFSNHGHTVGLRLRSGLFMHQDSYNIIDMYGNPVISCALQATKQGTIGNTGATYQVFSLSQRKEIRDGQGNMIFILANEYAHIHKTFVIKDPTSDENIAQIQAKFFSMHGEMKITFKNTSTNEDVELISRGSVFQRDATITLGKDGPVVARVAGQFTTIGGQGWNISIGPHEYSLAIAPGADIALITSIVICIDEIDRARQSSRTGTSG